MLQKSLLESKENAIFQLERVCVYKGKILFTAKVADEIQDYEYWKSHLVL